MDFCEDWESRGCRLVLRDKMLLAARFRKECLQDEHLGHVIESLNFLHTALFVVEYAARAVHAVFLLVERCTILVLLLLACVGEELVLTVRKAALFLVSAKARLYPVLAHLSLVFHFLLGCLLSVCLTIGLFIGRILGFRRL